MAKKEQTTLVPSEISSRDISGYIYHLRNTPVVLDEDLAKFYRVETKHLKRAVKRNIERFPADFMFELTKDELENLRCQIGTSSLEDSTNPLKNNENLRCQIGTSSLECQNITQKSSDDNGKHGGNRYASFAFTEFGVGMLSSVLHSERAIEINIAIMRAFVQLRKQVDIREHHLAQRIEVLEQTVVKLEQQLELFDNKALPAPNKPASLSKEDKVKAIQETVARYWGLKTTDLTSKARRRSISLARQTAIFLIREHLYMTFHEIGQHFGHRDHTTVLHGYRNIRANSNSNIAIRGSLFSLQKEIQPMFA